MPAGLVLLRGIGEVEHQLHNTIPLRPFSVSIDALYIALAVFTRLVVATNLHRSLSSSSGLLSALHVHDAKAKRTYIHTCIGTHTASLCLHSVLISRYLTLILFKIVLII